MNIPPSLIVVSRTTNLQMHKIAPFEVSNQLVIALFLLFSVLSFNYPNSSPKQTVEVGLLLRRKRLGFVGRGSFRPSAAYRWPPPASPPYSAAAAAAAAIFPGRLEKMVQLQNCHSTDLGFCFASNHKASGLPRRPTE